MAKETTEDEEWDILFEDDDEPNNPIEEQDFKFDSLKLIKRFETHADKINAKFHIRKINYDGASSFLNCNFQKCGRKLNLKLPPKNEVEERTDQFRQGNISHEYHEQVLRQIKQSNYLPEQVDIGTEVSIEEQPIKGVNYKIHTFIDFSYATRNKNPNAFKEGWVKAPYPVQGNHIGYKFNLLVPGSQFVQIGDIKTMSSYAFKKFQKGHLSWGQKGQFLIEMKHTNLDEIEVLGINKKTGQRHLLIYNWDQKIWDLVIEQIQDFLKLLENMSKITQNMELTTMFDYMEFYMKNGHTYIGEKNLLCLSMDKDHLAWWSCPLADKLVFRKSNWDAADGELSQKLNGFCPIAKATITEKHIEKFPVGSYYLRSSKTIVTVINKHNIEQDKFPEKTIFLQGLDRDNKKARVFICELFKGRQSIKKPKPIKFIAEVIDDWDYIFINYKHIDQKKLEKYLSYPTLNLIGVDEK